MDIGAFFNAIGKFIEGGFKALLNISHNPEPVKSEILPPVLAQTSTKRVITEDYMNTSWSTRNAPTLALDRIDVELQNPTDENLRMSTNTCKQLLENFSMLKDRKTRIENIRDKIMKSDSEMAKEIDLGRFSKADWYDGPPNLWR